MKINANGKPVEISGETIIRCRVEGCGGMLWAKAETGALYCPRCVAGNALSTARAAIAKSEDR